MADNDSNIEHSEHYAAVQEALDIMNATKKKKDELRAEAEEIDLDSIEMEEHPTVASQRSALTSILKGPVFQVTCAQSGYTAKVSALIYKDIVDITNSSLSNYESRKQIYKTIYSKIAGYSADDWHPSFEEWCKYTSLGDVETLFYGLYCATFPDSSSVKYECPFCGTSNVINVSNNSLIHTSYDKQEMMALSDKIAREASTVDKIKEFSSVVKSDFNKSNTKNIRLPGSKMVFTLRLPSLHTTLELLRTFDESELAKKSTDATNLYLMTAELRIPETTGKYSKVENGKDIFHIIDMLSIEDFAALKAVAMKMLEDKHITYKIENQICSNEKCHRKIAEIPLDIESLLFFQISEKQLM